MKINAIIVDDESRAHKIIESYSARITGLYLAGNFTDALSAREFIKKNEVDLIFLDITMPEVSGFDLVRLLKNPPLIIFTTAHPEFAFESYDYDAVDYLKKPIPFERFAKAIAKVNSVLSIRKPDAGVPNQIQLKIEGEEKIIRYNTIHYFQSLGNYIKIITDDKPLIVQMTTSEIEAALPREVFIRIHKSFIVNRTKISSIYEDELTLGNFRLPVGKTFKKYVRESLQ